MHEQKPSWFDERLEDGIDPAMREAIDWFNMLQSGDMTERDRVAFRAWLRRDPGHARALEEVEGMWRGLAELPEAQKRRGRMTRRNFGKGLLALAAAGGAWSVWQAHPFADYRTGTGERRSVTLPDGSRAELSTSTALSLDYAGPARRGIVLHKGEAFFTVAADPNRPFIVETARGRVTALGTAFSVNDEGSRVAVTVTEHAVRIDAAARSLRLEAGLQAGFDAREIAAPVAVNTDDVLAWRENRLVFVNAKLGRVVEALNRWRAGRIVVTDSALVDYPVTLIVNLEDVESALGQLRDALPITLTSITPLLTLIRAR